MAQDLHVFCWGRALPSRKGLLDLGPRTTRNSASPEAKSTGTRDLELKKSSSTLQKVNESKPTMDEASGISCNCRRADGQN